MKYITTALLILFTTFASAQIVNIPDPVFKQLLLNYDPVIDINHDGEIQTSEAAAVTELSIQGTISDLTGLHSFINLQNLIYFPTVLDIDLSNFPQLKQISIYSSFPPGIHSINLMGCLNLEYFRGGTLGYPTKALLGHLPRLKTFALQETDWGTLDFTGCDSLSFIDFPPLGGSGTIDTLNISGLTQLDSLFDFGKINDIIAKNCTGLKVINNYGNPYDIKNSLDVTGCINLEEIYFMSMGPSFSSLDLSSCTNLKSFTIAAACAHLINLTLKNGHYLNKLNLFGSHASDPPLNICADDFEVDSVVNMVARTFAFSGYGRQVNVNSYCSFFPGGTYNTIKGNIKLDLNNNGCDNNDAGMQNVPVKFTDTSGQSIIQYSNTTGEYYAYTYKGIFSILPYFPYAYFTITPATATVNFDTANNLIATKDFCIQPNGTHNDLEITFLPYGAARPGFNNSYHLIYKNRRTTTLSGNVQVNFNTSKMNFISATTPVSSQTSGQLTWNFNNLLPFQNKMTDVTFNLLPSPVNNINDTLTFLAIINPVAGDETPYDNSFILPQLVRGSYDPNDKQCLEGSKIAFANIDKYLHYIIHFQNLGNDTAFNVVVADTLSNKLDWNTVEIIGSSHTCDVKQTNGKLEFFFRDIKLPYKAINDAGSNGFVAFKVKPKNTVSLGDSLNNRAAIYFDFNPPVITNMATTVVSLIPTIPVKLEYFSGSKKDETNVLTWKAPSTNGSTNFIVERSNDGIHFTGIGNINATLERSQLPFNFTDNIPLFGKNYYRLKITDADRVIFYSKIILLENSRTGIEIISIISNKENTTAYINASKQQTIQLKIIALDGRVISYDNKMIEAGSNRIAMRFNKIASGIYTMVIYTNEGELITKRFVK